MKHKITLPFPAAARVLVLVVPVALALLLSSCAASNSKSATTPPTSTNGGSTSTPVTDADITIPLAQVTDEPSFYPATIDGAKLEVLAVKASDGSIRTAFNTCQVCYDSGRGYYQWNGTALQCQNCGNQFAPDQVEVEVGGCNPVPIFDADKTDDGTTITIALSYLQEQKALFENWGK
jgi:uncharacterized membrane protein